MKKEANILVALDTHVRMCLPPEMRLDYLERLREEVGWEPKESYETVLVICFNVALNVQEKYTNATIL